MKLIKPLALKSGLLIFLSMFSSMAFAGPGINVGNMAFHIAPAAIPTLSTTMLIVLSLLLFAVAFRVAKQKNSSANKLFLTLIGVTALSTGAGGIKLISDVEAGVVATLQTVTLNTNLTPTTGQVDLFGPQTNYFDNPYAVDVTIDNITIFPGFICLTSGGSETAVKAADPEAPPCNDEAPNNIIPPGGQCKLRCFSDSMDGSG